MTTFYTRRNLVDQALGDLGVRAAGQTASSEDVAAVDGYIPALFATLAARNIITIADTEAIEAAAFLPLAKTLAHACRDEFGDAKIDVAKAEADLRAISSSGPTYEVLRTQYF
jgi:hypothetical protein